MSRPTPEPPETGLAGSMTGEVKLLYEATWRKAEVFFEWRHKVMTFSVTVVAAGLVAAGWLVNNDSSQFLVGLLLLFLATLLLLTFLLDRRVARHMLDAYRAGAYLEDRIRDPEIDWKASEGLLPFEALLAGRHEPRPDAPLWRRMRLRRDRDPET